ncbi:KTSC domain-containing protein [Providencia rettgeri]
MIKFYVGSSSIEFIGYDDASKILLINHIDNKCYQYDNVPFIEYQRLMSATCPLKYIIKHINGSYKQTQVN